MTDFSTQGKHDEELRKVMLQIKQELSRRQRYRNLIRAHEVAVAEGYSMTKIKRARTLAERARRALEIEGVS